MYRLIKNTYWLLLLLLAGCALNTQQSNQKPWTHIELGGGNYGKDGHTKISQHKTVLMDLKYVTKAPNYIDQLPYMDKVTYDPNHQFAVLFATLDQLVSKRGPRGVFHVNDYYAEYADDATQNLKNYAKKKGYKHIIIESIPGDYLKIAPKNTLAAYGVAVYDSVHLKNPEVSFYNYGMNGDNMLSNAKSRKKARSKLQTLANLSCEGLYFFAIDPADFFIPTPEREQFIQKGIFYQATTEWEPVPYYFPEGPKMGKEYGNVYFIKSKNPNCLESAGKL